MTTTRATAAFLAATAFLAAGTALAQLPPLPKAGPEHAALKADEGTWEATVESWMVPGAPSATSKGVETNTLLNGMWLVTDFKGDFMGTPFLGHGLGGYDAVKKKYVSTWVDTMAVGLSIGESTYDPATRTMSGWLEGPDPSGKVMRSRTTTEHKDADTRILTMYNKGADGKEAMSLRITYKRRK